MKKIDRKTMDTKEIVENFEFKKRVYLLKQTNNEQYQLRTRSKRRPLLYTDMVAKKNKELRFCTNEDTPFIDEQGDNARVGHLFFKGSRIEAKEGDIGLQLLMFFHPDNVANGGSTFYEKDFEAEREDALEAFEATGDATVAVREADIDTLQSVVYDRIGAEAFSMSSKEIKLDAYNLAKSSPKLLLNLLNDDMVSLKGTAKRAEHLGVIDITGDGNTIKYSGSKKKICSVSSDKTPYEALASFFLTDGGIPVLKTILKNIEDL